MDSNSMAQSEINKNISKIKYSNEELQIKQNETEVNYNASKNAYGQQNNAGIVTINQPNSFVLQKKQDTKVAFNNNDNIQYNISTSQKANQVGDTGLKQIMKLIQSGAASEFKSDVGEFLEIESYKKVQFDDIRFQNAITGTGKVLLKNQKNFIKQMENSNDITAELADVNKMNVWLKANIAVKGDDTGKLSALSRVFDAMVNCKIEEVDNCLAVVKTAAKEYLNAHKKAPGSTKGKQRNAVCNWILNELSVNNLISEKYNAYISKVNSEAEKDTEIKAELDRLKEQNPEKNINLLNAKLHEICQKKTDIMKLYSTNDKGKKVEIPKAERILFPVLKIEDNNNKDNQEWNQKYKNNTYEFSKIIKEEEENKKIVKTNLIKIEEYEKTILEKENQKENTGDATLYEKLEKEISELNKNIDALNNEIVAAQNNISNILSQKRSIQKERAPFLDEMINEIINFDVKDLDKLVNNPLFLLENYERVERIKSIVTLVSDSNGTAGMDKEYFRDIPKKQREKLYAKSDYIFAKWAYIEKMIARFMNYDIVSSRFIDGDENSEEVYHQMMEMTKEESDNKEKKYNAVVKKQNSKRTIKETVPRVNVSKVRNVRQLAGYTKAIDKELNVQVNKMYEVTKEKNIQARNNFVDQSIEHVELDQIAGNYGVISEMVIKKVNDIYKKKAQISKNQVICQNFNKSFNFKENTTDTRNSKTTIFKNINKSDNDEAYRKNEELADILESTEIKKEWVYDYFEDRIDEFLNIEITKEMFSAKWVVANLEQFYSLVDTQFMFFEFAQGKFGDLNTFFANMKENDARKYELLENKSNLIVQWHEIMRTVVGQEYGVDLVKLRENVLSGTKGNIYTKKIDVENNAITADNSLGLLSTCFDKYYKSLDEYNGKR